MSPRDRRTAERFPVNQNTRCDFAAPLTAEVGPVRIKDVSNQGIGLVIGRRVEVGSMLAVTVANAAKSFTRNLLVRVAHVTPQGGGFLVGGTFTTPLTYEELTALVM